MAQKYSEEWWEEVRQKNLEKKKKKDRAEKNKKPKKKKVVVKKTAPKPKKVAVKKEKPVKVPLLPIRPAYNQKGLLAVSSLETADPEECFESRVMTARESVLERMLTVVKRENSLMSLSNALKILNETIVVNGTAGNNGATVQRQQTLWESITKEIMNKTQGDKVELKQQTITINGR